MSGRQLTSWGYNQIGGFLWKLCLDGQSPHVGNITWEPCQLYWTSVYPIANNKEINWLTTTSPEPWFTIKLSSHQCRKSHWGDKVVISLSYPLMGFPILVKWHLHIEWGPRHLMKVWFVQYHCHIWAGLMFWKSLFSVWLSAYNRQLILKYASK